MGILSGGGGRKRHSEAFQRAGDVTVLRARFFGRDRESHWGKVSTGRGMAVSAVSWT
jgi:hypothetical protein